MAGPTIIVHGTEEQKARLPARILSAEEIWCQGFSEPGAGSDLAVGAHARASCADGNYVVNGQKVWSSYAHLADWCMLITLSDPDAPRYKGLTYLLVDMHSPGVEVRPLRQITGEAEFNEIFFTDVEVPVENVLGGVGEGWQVAMTTLMHERGTLGFALAGALEVAIVKLLELARGRERRRRAHARPRRAELDRAPGAEADEQPRADAARRDRRARPGGVDHEAALVGGEPAARQARARAARAGGAARWRATATGSARSCAAAATRSRRAPRRSCATSSPSACSALPKGR